MALFEKFKRNKTLTPDERRAKTIEQLEKQGGAYNPHLADKRKGSACSEKANGWDADDA